MSELVEIMEVKEASKGEFRKLGVREGEVWVELKNLEDMNRVAGELDVKFIYKKDREYFFRAEGITHYCQE
ncbi:MAG: hypothetical protein ACOC6G_03715 [Thermoproteota archaeon]